MSLDVEKVQEAIIELLKKQGVEIKEESIVPIGVSNRHIHLSEDDLAACFGYDYELTPLKDLSQPGQFACKETVIICGPKGAIENVRILGPLRGKTQVEIFASDNFKLGIKAPLRISGELDGAAPITVIGPKGSVFLKEAAIVAKRHIHMTPEDAQKFGVFDGQEVSLEIQGARGGVLSNVTIRVTNSSKLDCHVDTEEANAMGLTNSSKAKIIK